MSYFKWQLIDTHASSLESIVCTFNLKQVKRDEIWTKVSEEEMCFDTIGDDGSRGLGVQLPDADNTFAVPKTGPWYQCRSSYATVPNCSSGKINLLCDTLNIT